MTPSKEDLYRDYYILKLSQQQIAEKYGYKTRQVIGRLFKKYDIKSKSKSILIKERMQLKNPSKDELEKLYNNYSITEISKKLNLSRKYISSLMEEYEITKTYFKYFITDEVFLKEINNLSLKEIEIKYQFPIVELKRRKLNKFKLPKINYNKNRIKKILSLYDLNNPGFSKQIINDDLNVYNSIINHTKEHIISSNKITEKIYRIINDYDPNFIPRCAETGEILKFYTIEKGYGNSNLNLTKKGFSLSYNFSCYSKVSQKLFWEIYNNLDEENKNKVQFAQLNSEKKIQTNNSNKNLNKYHFSLDFCLENKNIEFDGEYWHSIFNIIEKDKIRDEFLLSLGYKILRITERDYYNNPQETLNKCIEFLSK